MACVDLREKLKKRVKLNHSPGPVCHFYSVDRHLII